MGCLTSCGRIPGSVATVTAARGRDAKIDLRSGVNESRRRGHRLLSAPFVQGTGTASIPHHLFSPFPSHIPESFTKGCPSVEWALAHLASPCPTNNHLTLPRAGHPSTPASTLPTHAGIQPRTIVITTLPTPCTLPTLPTLRTAPLLSSSFWSPTSPRACLQARAGLPPTAHHAVPYRTLTHYHTDLAHAPCTQPAEWAA
jgi:hypothetical protein